MNATAPARPGLLDRLTDWTLDTRGDIYGDEHERLRWYEGIALAASAQWLLLPAVAAVAVVGYGRPAVGPTAVLIGLLWVTQLVTVVHVRRHRVPAVQRRWSGKAVAISVVASLCNVAYFLACAHVLDGLDSYGLTGGLVGGTAAAAVMAVLHRRRRTREARPVADED